MDEGFDPDEKTDAVSCSYGKCKSNATGQIAQT